MLPNSLAARGAHLVEDEAHPRSGRVRRHGQLLCHGRRAVGSRQVHRNEWARSGARKFGAEASSLPSRQPHACTEPLRPTPHACLHVMSRARPQKLLGTPAGLLFVCSAQRSMCPAPVPIARGGASPGPRCGLRHPCTRDGPANGNPQQAPADMPYRVSFESSGVEPRTSVAVTGPATVLDQAMPMQSAVARH